MPKGGVSSVSIYTQHILTPWDHRIIGFCVAAPVPKKKTNRFATIWSYEEEDKWGKRYSTCDGISQSPINIHPTSVVEENDLILNFQKSYQTPIQRAVLSNTGLTGWLIFSLPIVISNVSFSSLGVQERKSAGSIWISGL